MKFLSVARMIFSALVKPRQQVEIQEIPQGRILDIGGGGEGVIAQVGGDRVVAVDKYSSEIDEARGRAPAGAWVVADATALPCANRSFDSATSFFSCMYMSDEVKQKVFRETRRVLKERGEFWVWDARMARGSGLFAIRLRVDLRGARTINTTYGVKAKDQSAGRMASMLEEAGFEPEVVVDQKHWFLIKAR